MSNVKNVLVLFVAAISIYEKWVGWLLLLYACTMVLDMLTGTVCAIKEHNWSSSIAVAGIWKKCGSILTILATTLTDVVLQIMLQHIPTLHIPNEYQVLLLPLVLSWYTFTEMGSIIENAARMGAPVPPVIAKALRVVNHTLNGEKVQ